MHWFVLDIIPSAYRRILRALVVWIIVLLTSRAARGVDIEGSLPISFDLPRIYGVLQPAGGGTPYTGEDFFGNPTFTLGGFLDTGASGIVIDTRLRPLFDIPVVAGATFSDVAIGGNTDFSITPNLDLRIAPSTALDLDRTSTLTSVYNQLFPSVRAQIGPTNISIDPVFPELNVYGMPAMMGKTVVIDPRPVNSFLDFMHTFIYDPGEGFRSDEIDTDPGIPTTSHHVKLSYASFDRFTQTMPDGATPPTQNHNPFIGPDPLHQFNPGPEVDDTPQVRLEYGGRQTTGSLLFDSGAITSFISSSLADQLNIQYADGTFGTDEPRLVFADNPGADVPDQFLFPVGGLGGTAVLAGFFLDHLVVETVEGGPGENAQNIRYLRAPVFVNDIALLDPLTQEIFVLDGIFGMNFMSASALVSLDLNVFEAREGAFNWITFNEPDGILGLDLGIQVPEPGSIVLAAVGLVALAGYACRQRRRKMHS